jgi:hypothetical protein
MPPKRICRLYLSREGSMLIFFTNWESDNLNVRDGNEAFDVVDFIVKPLYHGLLRQSC